MAKKVTHAVESVQSKQYRMDKNVLRVACDDGTTYVFEREDGGRRWTCVARYGRDGERSASPSRLPAAVEAHMDGRTQSGPHGEDSPAYWA